MRTLLALLSLLALPALGQTPRLEDGRWRVEVTQGSCDLIADDSGKSMSAIFMFLPDGSGRVMANIGEWRVLHPGVGTRSLILTYSGRTHPIALPVNLPSGPSGGQMNGDSVEALFGLLARGGNILFRGPSSATLVMPALPRPIGAQLAACLSR